MESNFKKIKSIKPQKVNLKKNLYIFSFPLRVNMRVSESIMSGGEVSNTNIEEGLIKNSLKNKMSQLAQKV